MHFSTKITLVTFQSNKQLVIRTSVITCRKSPLIRDKVNEIFASGKNERGEKLNAHNTQVSRVSVERAYISRLVSQVRRKPRSLIVTRNGVFSCGESFAAGRWVFFLYANEHCIFHGHEHCVSPFIATTITNTMIIELMIENHSNLRKSSGRMNR